MAEFWICIGKQLSKSSEYSRNPSGQFSAYARVVNMPEYGWIMSYDKVLNISDQLFTGLSFQFSICPGSGYGKVANMWGLYRVLNVAE